MITSTGAIPRSATRSNAWVVPNPPGVTCTLRARPWEILTLNRVSSDGRNAKGKQQCAGDPPTQRKGEQRRDHDLKDVAAGSSQDRAAHGNFHNERAQPVPAAAKKHDEKGSDQRGQQYRQRGPFDKEAATRSRYPLFSPNPAFAIPKITSSTVPRIVDETPCTARVASTAVMLNDGKAAR